ncbi:Reverse gyrase [Jannaschia aquimarina]|uniref:Rgy protein n=2 Tax=Jannaschia aquimarina TaxID=935700 RepID=A0A0D1EIA5_9RHOB|nr:DEAD/DEAH box helicase [Jannaschia aquimarina]KIT15585.1 Reverse gyrase [Jannaschia aquimarina]SNT27299.1 Helicase C-terminal domain-containing protein [Jannaschia aquimarina]
MSHQKEILADYVSVADRPDVALQLPTGSGKTLVGLFIAEWRRRKFSERVVYLCPTKQLVHQTVQQAKEQYGIDAVGLTGPKSEFSPSDRASYRTGAKVVITTYSALFNVNPFFDDPDTVILDDAHAAENYVAKMWSLEIPAGEADAQPLHQGVSGLLKPRISATAYSRLTGDWVNAADASWADKLPTEDLIEVADQLIAVLDAHADGYRGAKYVWPLLRDHLQACHLYMSSRGILIRPLIPPTWSHAPFQNAKHRLYMSATLGSGGDLERLTGRSRIDRVKAPPEFRKAGVGRRFFMFPGLSLTEDECRLLRADMIKRAGRAVVLTPSGRQAERVKEDVKAIGVPLFEATDIEASKTAFVEANQAVAVLAGRFDGIDFPNDECRLLCLDGLPAAANAQEQFLVAGMGATALLRDRMQTRVLQAAGRCTRSLQDRSVVFVMGGDLENYLADDRLWDRFHPELQSELAFGVEQSVDQNAASFLENLDAFLKNDAAWEEANEVIVTNSADFEENDEPAMNDLSASVAHEIAYMKAIWSGDAERAYEASRQAVASLGYSTLQGYRALWHYLSGSAANMVARVGKADFAALAVSQFDMARQSAPNVRWLAKPRAQIGSTSEESVDARDSNLSVQVEQMEATLLALGTASDRKFEKRAADILNKLGDGKTFEEGQRLLGELLGFTADNTEEAGGPDPWWVAGTSGIVFEDHANAQSTTVFPIEKARQAAGHPKWLTANRPNLAEVNFQVILVTPCTIAAEGGQAHLVDVRLFGLNAFRVWASDAIATVRTLKVMMKGEPDLAWRAEAASALRSNNLDIGGISGSLTAAFVAFSFK